MAEVVSTAPRISQEDFANFHATHFSTTLVVHFAEHFLVPVEEKEYIEEAEDDGLGYYEDGTKCTLTDEQITIFRHSEIQTLLRERRHAAEAKADEYESLLGAPTDPTMDGGVGKSPPGVEPMAETAELEDGELDEDDPTSQASTPRPLQQLSNNKNKRKYKNGKKGQRSPQPKGFFRQNVKPDLRKRTWDVVDAGLGNLDYDEGSGGAPAPNHASQRRRISYEDD